MTKTQIQCTYNACPKKRTCIRFTSSPKREVARVISIPYMNLSKEKAKEVECPMYMQNGEIEEESSAEG